MEGKVAEKQGESVSESDTKGGGARSYTERRGEVGGGGGGRRMVVGRSRSENEREFLVLSPSSSSAASNSVYSSDRGFFLPSTSGCALSGWSVASAGYQAPIWG